MTLSTNKLAAVDPFVAEDTYSTADTPITTNQRNAISIDSDSNNKVLIN